MATDNPENPKRVDSNGVPLDHQMVFMNGGGTVTPFLGVAQGGSPASETNPLAQLASFAASDATGKTNITFTEQSAADKYEIEYWLTSTPQTKSAVYVANSGLDLGLPAGAYTLRGRALMEYGRGKWVEGAWSATDPATVS